MPSSGIAGPTIPRRTCSPMRDEGQRFPQLGIAPPSRLTLLSVAKQPDFKPAIPGTPGGRGDADVRAGRPHRRDERPDRPRER